MKGHNNDRSLREALGLEESSPYLLGDVQDYLKDILTPSRIDELYSMISNPEVRVNSNDKKWVAYTTQASENKTVFDAIREILGDNQVVWAMKKLNVIAAIDKVGTMFESDDVKMKPRIPFYILVLDFVVD